MSLLSKPNIFLSLRNRLILKKKTIKNRFYVAIFKVNYMSAKT